VPLLVAAALPLVVLAGPPFRGKDRILELYLDTVELGPGIFGVGAASRAYFDVPAQQVSRVQAALLAGRNVVIPPEPEPVAMPERELSPPDVHLGPEAPRIP